MTRLAFCHTRAAFAWLSANLHCLTLSPLLCQELRDTDNESCISVQAGAAVPDKQPNNLAANIPKLPRVGAGKAVHAFPSPSAKGIVSSGKATSAKASSPGKGAPSDAQAFPANPPAAGSSQVIHIELQLLLCEALHGGECTAEIVC